MYSIFKNKPALSQEERRVLQAEAKAYDERELRNINPLSELDPGLTVEQLERLAEEQRSKGFTEAKRVDKSEERLGSFKRKA